MGSRAQQASTRLRRNGFGEAVGGGALTGPEENPKGTWRRWLPPVGFALAIVAESSQAAVTVPTGLWNGDKLVHFLAFGLLGTVILRALRIERAWLRALVVAAIASLFGASDEIHQAFTPGRSCDVLDWVADTLGATTAAAAYLWWPAYRRLLETRLGRRR
jgi:VanZ family protein